MNKKSIVLSIATFLSFSGITSADYVIKFNNSQSKGMIPEKSVPETFSSCKDILDNGQSTGDGVYTINVNSKEFDVYCDMTSAGGGWTMIIAQFEPNPVDNWNEGVQSDYDPSLQTEATFILNDNEIPSHNEIAFGKDFDADFVEYFNFNYQGSGEINRTTITGLKNNEEYRVQRNLYTGASSCNNYSTTTRYNKNQFSLTKQSENYNWCFEPRASGSETPGKGMLGNVRNTSEDFAWTVWVR